MAGSMKGEKSELFLFEGYPALENERLVLRRMSASDADALGRLAHDREVYAEPVLVDKYVFKKRWLTEGVS